MARVSRETDGAPGFISSGQASHPVQAKSRHRPPRITYKAGLL